MMIRTPVRHGYEIEHGLIVDVENKPVIKIEDFRVRDHIIIALNAYKALYNAGAASVSRKEVVEWEFSKVRKIVADTIPEHHRTGTAGVVYAAMIAAMDAVLTDLEAKK